LECLYIDFCTWLWCKVSDGFPVLNTGFSKLCFLLMFQSLAILYDVRLFFFCYNDEGVRCDIKEGEASRVNPTQLEISDIMVWSLHL